MSAIADRRSKAAAAQPGGGTVRDGVRSASSGTLVVRLLFGITWAIDAVLKWLPGYRHSFLSQLQGAAQGQPSWLHWWFHGWISLQSHAPALFADLTGLAETTLALVLLLGVARRAGYLFGIVYTLLVWSVGEGFGGPYASGSTDVGTGIILAILFAALYVTAPSAAQERLSVDRTLITRWSWWKYLAEPHAADRG
jgi:thiosulfate dehydrogenase [quinone] large subunit